MARRLVIGNWKMHGTAVEARELAAGVRQGFRRRRSVEVVLCPPFTALGIVGAALRRSSIALGAQNCHWDAAGAHTGEIALPMLVEVGCRYVLVGHSERRHELGETDAFVNRKVLAAVAHGVTPVLCVGETAEERAAGRTLGVVERQLTEGARGVAPEALVGLVLAYEPVWAIGTGATATPAEAATVHGALRRLLVGLAGPAAAGIRILYGGSVKPDNAAELLAAPDVDGALVGGASLSVGAFVDIAKQAAGSGAAARSV